MSCEAPALQQVSSRMGGAQRFGKNRSLASSVKISFLNAVFRPPFRQRESRLGSRLRGGPVTQTNLVSRPIPENGVGCVIVIGPVTVAV